MNNQFSNCELKSIIYTPIVTFRLRPDSILQDFINCCYKYFRHYERDYANGRFKVSEVELEVEKYNDKDGLNYLFSLLEDNKVRLDVKERTKKIYKALIPMVRGINIDYSKLSENYTREDYIHDNLAILASVNEDDLAEDEQRLYSTYWRLNDTRNEFLSLIEGQDYLFTNYIVSGIDIPDQLVNDFETVVHELNEIDQIFKHKVFRLQLDWKDGLSMDDKKKSLYRRLRKLFLKMCNPKKPIKRIPPRGGDRKNAHYYSIKSIPPPKEAFNLNFSNSYTRQHLPFWKFFQPSPVIILVD